MANARTEEEKQHKKMVTVIGRASRMMEVTRGNAYEFDADWFTENNITFDYDYNYADYGSNDDNYADYGSYNTCCAASPCDSITIQSFEKVFLPGFYSLIFLIGLIGNGMVMGVLLKFKHTLTVTDIYLLYLAVADILMVVALPFWAVEAVHWWIFGTATCKVIGSVFKINLYSGILFLGCIIFERYLSTVHAVQMYQKCKPCSIHLSCFAIWVFCFLLTIPVYCNVMIFKTQRASRRFKKWKDLWVNVAVVVAFFLCWAPYNLTLGVDTLIKLNLLPRDCDMESRLAISMSVSTAVSFLSCMPSSPLSLGTSSRRL
ncbi:C-X-C chemokine receptor type 3-like [Latimeria chalumnae]|uniref:C-X-C chemokine receptor type 3-like n=1 Tax=Latimeria chalumnae TaxID=7897 RepID=UPI00313B0D88